jgi:hypothetical protein
MKFHFPFMSTRSLDRTSPSSIFAPPGSDQPEILIQKLILTTSLRTLFMDNSAGAWSDEGENEEDDWMYDVVVPYADTTGAFEGADMTMTAPSSCCAGAVPDNEMQRCARVLCTRSLGRGTVEDRFKAILGTDIEQNELSTLRKGLFSGVLAPPGRGEKRSKAAMLSSYEANRQAVLAILDRPEAILHVVQVAARLRGQKPRKSKRDNLLMHFFER